MQGYLNARIFECKDPLKDLLNARILARILARIF
jgi:hypothetical protein